MEIGLVTWLTGGLAGLLIVFLPRKWVLAPLLTVALIVPPAEQVVVAGLHFPLTRVLILFGWVRVLFKPQSISIRLNSVDKCVIAWIAAAILTYTLLWQSGAAFANRCGLFLIDTLGMYALVRTSVRDSSDIKRIMSILAVISVPIAGAMLIERSTGHNPFSVFGAVPQITELRGDRLRCQGPFMHPVMAGSFGAALFPLVLGLWWAAVRRSERAIGALGVVASAVIAITSSSSGPILAFSAAVLGFLMWPIRRHMRTVRWGLLFTIITLQIVMKAPVWSLIGRANIFSASRGYHREVLIDAFIDHFSEWFLVGIKSTYQWGPWYLSAQDLTNQFLRVAADGGIVTLALFIAVISLGFRAAGKARRSFRRRLSMQKLSWAVGVALFTNVVAFFGCSYWDQVVILWYTLLALVSALFVISQKESQLERRRQIESTPDSFVEAASLQPTACA